MKNFLISLAFLSISLWLAGQESIIKEEYVSLPTYPFSDPDPIARPGKIYPYFRFEGYSLKPVETKHRMVTMENSWIKVWIAPDMGGKVYGALDKKTGKHFIYFNNVVKFREIAMRGPWTSGGIEFNFGSIGHAPTTATPVDYHYQSNPDGSVSCFLGALELTSRTEWRVEVKLPPDKAWFEIRSYWFNPTNQKTSLYHWQTAAADATDDLRYYFPGKAYIDHDGNAYKWPVMADGRDISLYGNNNYGNYHSYHVLGVYTDWFAGYYAKSGYGFGHLNKYPEKPGKKIWIWGLSRQGEIWKGLLTDSLMGNGQYTEIQTGLLFNQEADGSTFSPFKHMFFLPGAAESFSEKWFPVSNTRGVKMISEEGILNIENSGNGSRLMFQSLGYINDSIILSDNEGELLYTFKLDLEPEQIFEKEIDIDPDKIVVRLKRGGLSYRPGAEISDTLYRPLKADPDFDWQSVYGLYTRGIEKYRQRLYAEARVFLNKCLESDKNYIPAYTALAELDIRQMEYADAEKNIMKVLSFDTYDPDANFLYGYLLLLKQDYQKARDAFGITLRYPAYKSVAYKNLALLALKEKKAEEAWDYLSKAGLYNGMDNDISNFALVTSRLRNDSISFKLLLEKLTATDPLSYLAAFERYYSSKDSVTLNNFISGINTELKHETFIELALWYFNVGLDNEALEILELSPRHPLVDYLAAYHAFRLKDTKKADFYLDRALSADDKLVFPFRDEYILVLGWALDYRSGSWKNKYYNALLCWSRDNIKMASHYFSDCKGLPDSYSFYIARGNFLYQTGGNAEPDYLQALKYGADKWRPYHTLHGFYMSKSEYQKALNISSEAMKKFSESYIIRTDHSRSLLSNGRYGDCIRLLEKTVIIPYEGAAYGRTIWRQANLLEAIRLLKIGNSKTGEERVKAARLWPENLGVGKPYTVDESYEDLLEAICKKQQKLQVPSDKIKPLIASLYSKDTSKLTAGDPELLIIDGIKELCRVSGLAN